MKKASIIVCMLILIISASAYFFLPETIPVHFNGQGAVDRYGNRMEIFVFAFISLAASAALLLARRMDPKRENYERFMKTFYTIIFMVNLIILGIMFMTLMESFHPGSINVNIFMCMLLGMMFATIGNIMPKTKSNFMIGVRTPWTLSSDEVWYRTHRMAGKLWFIGGIVLMMGGFLSPDFVIIFIVAAALLLSIIPCIYSYICYRQISSTDSKQERKSYHD